MIKLLQAATLGGAPITKADLRVLFQLELWDVIEGIFSAQFGADVQGLILSGCAVTNNAGNFDMSAGVVFLNGQFMRVPAVTNQAFTKYIQPGTVVDDSRTFADASVHAVMETTPAVCQAGIPGSGQYITISSLTSADAQRWGKVFDSLTSTNIIRGLSARQGSLLQPIAQVAWTNITLINGWTNSVGTLKYRIDTAGKVHISGKIDAATSTNDVFANLPVAIQTASMTAGMSWLVVPGDNTVAEKVMSIATASGMQIVSRDTAKSYRIYVSYWPDENS